MAALEPAMDSMLCWPRGQFTHNRELELCAGPWRVPTLHRLLGAAIGPPDSVSPALAAALLEVGRLGRLEDPELRLTAPGREALLQVRRTLAQRTLARRAAIGCVLAHGGRWNPFTVELAPERHRRACPQAVLLDHGHPHGGPATGEISHLCRQAGLPPGKLVVARLRRAAPGTGLPDEWRFGIETALRVARDAGRRRVRRWAAVGAHTPCPDLDRLPGDVRVLVVEPGALCCADGLETWRGTPGRSGRAIIRAEEPETAAARLLEMTG